MTPKEIKIHLLKNDLTVKQIAEELGVRRDMVSQQINGHYDYPSLRRKLAERYGIVCPPLRTKHIAAEAA
jgi:DNA-binding CsgD family transcriptional regulator